jgi:uncharacterized protein
MGVVTGHGFHDGELAVQRRAGVEKQAARLAGMLAAPDIHGGFQRFLADQDFAVITARDHAGRLWASPLHAYPGFLEGHHQVLRVHATPPVADPLAGLRVGQPVGLLAIDFTNRRRVRVNGALADADPAELTIHVDQAYGNCPKYIAQRELRHARTVSSPSAGASRRSTLDAADIETISSADTFFLGTIHPQRGADASHRGGLPGFVRVADAREIWWPDYQGNDMFNSLGNLTADPTATLLFVDYHNGKSLHLSGSATLEWTRPGVGGDDGDTGRRVRFTIDRVVTGPRLGVSSGPADPSRNNPPLRQ